MPSFARSTSVSSELASGSDGVHGHTTSASSAGSSVHVGSDDYVAKSFPDYSEKPLDQQLEPIAVVGIGCHLPGNVKSSSQLWDLLMSKDTGNTPKVPSSRFNIDAHIHANNDRPGSFGVLEGYFLQDDIREFDPTFFNITPVEAMWMDPQQRKLLEVVYEALESGGIPLEKIASTRTAVFAACFTADWQQMSFKEHSFRHSLAATGVDPGIISNRISHIFNLNGPSIMCNTACSSSVYALHNACNALRNGEAEGAIVGGVDLIITVDQHMNTAKLGVLSPTSTCHTFDASADGYGRADAVGAVYLKRLSDAVRDGDPIRGVIRSSATNSNGKVPGYGITYPNREGQAEVIAAAYKRGGDLDPRLTGYFECHGTGTPVGDPLEVQAVSIAMNKQRQPNVDQALWIGAVKTNIGHSEAASGISALIKAILIAERGVIPATRGVVDLNPAIKWDDWQVRVPTDAVPFPRELPVRRVSINSFGYGGTNAHVIVEATESIARHGAAPYTYVDKWVTSWKSRSKKPGFRRTLERKRPYLLPFSAHDKATLRRNIDTIGRVASYYNLPADQQRLHHCQPWHFGVGLFCCRGNFCFCRYQEPLAFVFTGQGAQWAGMGADLMDYSPKFLRSIRKLDLVPEHLHDGPDWSIEDVLREQPDTSPVNDAEFSQPLCTAVQIAIVQLLDSWGVKPVATVGHSSGEIAAAYAAGLVSAEDAIIAAYYRGVVAKEVNTNGSMMAVGLGADAVKEYVSGFEDQVVIACHNSPVLVTLSGDEDALRLVQARLEAASVFNRIVKTGGKAYHSHHMAPASERYKNLVHEAKKNGSSYSMPLATIAKMVSSVTNSVLAMGEVLGAEYWCSNLRSPVLFNQAVQTLLNDREISQVDVLVEVGPHPALAGPIKQIKEAVDAKAIGYVPTLMRGEDSGVRLLKVAGELFLRGYGQIDMETVTRAYAANKGVQGTKGPGPATIVDLPSYQWNYARPLWAENRASREQRLPKFPRHDVLGQRVIGGSLAEPTWANILRLRDLPWLKDHSLGGEAVFPAAGYFAMAIEAASQLNEIEAEESGEPASANSYVLRDIDIKKALVTPDTDDGIEVLINLRPSAFGGPWWDFGVSSVDVNGIKREHMTGSISINTAAPRGVKQSRFAPRFPQRASGKAWNQALRAVGFDYGPTFQDMDNVRFDGKTYAATCTTNIKREVDSTLSESRYALHPAVVDSTLQLSIAAIYAGRTSAMDCGVVPVQVDEITIWPPTDDQLTVKSATAYAWVDHRGTRTFENSVQMTAADGAMIMEIFNVRTTRYEAAVPQKDELALSPAPYGEMTWQLDIDRLDAVNICRKTSSDLVSLGFFKFPGIKVLDAASNVAAAALILDKNPLAAYTLAVNAYHVSDIDAEAELQSFPNTTVTTIQDCMSESAESPQNYDMLVVPEHLVASLQAFVMPGGHLVIVDGKGSTVSLQTVPKTEPGKVNPLNHDAALALVYRNSVKLPILNQIRSAVEAVLGVETNRTDVETHSLQSCNDRSKSLPNHIIMLADFEAPLLSSLTEDEFSAIQRITNSASSLLWVSNGGLLEGKRPEHAMASGIARVLRSEQASLDVRVLDVDTDTDSHSLISATIAQIVDDQLNKNQIAPEKEYCLSRGELFISRIVRNEDLNRMFSALDNPTSTTIVPDDRISGVISHGKVIFECGEGGEQDLAPDTVEVQVQRSGLTREGVLAVIGADYPTTFSHTLGGVIVRVGAGVTSLAPGDRVVGLHIDRFSTLQQIPPAMLHKLDTDQDMAEVVSMLMANVTALYGLDVLVRLKAGEKVLVLHGTGIMGTAIAQTALTRGADVYVEAKTQDEVDFLKKSVGLSSEHILHCLDGTLWNQIARLSNGRGFDVVFSVGGAVDTTTAREAWRNIAPIGRFLDAGRKSSSAQAALDPTPMRRSAQYLSYDTLSLLETRPDVLAGLLPSIIGVVKSCGIHSPGRTTQISLSDINMAILSFSNDFGAINPVVALDIVCEAPVMMKTPSRQKLAFRGDATYLLVGCLGGLGRSLTRWMMESGAKRFLFLSRSGTDAPSAAKLVEDLGAAGATIKVVRGDATNRKDVVRAVQQVPSTNPLRGVVHAAMVLRDGMFHSMPFSSWKASVAPKVGGAGNLHSVLANTPLDFFLMTSSVSGILGTPGQANYAAANTYMDALAKHRVHNAQEARSCVIPMVLGVDVVSENDELEDALRRKGMYGIDEQHLLQSFEAAVVSKTDHVVTGLDPMLLHKAAADAGDSELSASFWVDDARFSHVVQAIRGSNSAGAAGTAGANILSAAKAAASSNESVILVETHFARKLATMLMMDEDDIDAAAGSIASYGIDSMIGAELRNWIFKEYRIDIPFQQLLAPDLTIHKFAKQVCTSVGIDI
uniref:Polyketide synthase n=1 Tax=Pestalotiopsis microspora TaxID=85828 RepID=A0A1P8NTI9_PESMI|nr:polyketide synthase [Pestalotiopsis microspora]